MAKGHRRLDTRVAQEVSLDHPDFLREIVERVLEAEMTEHVGATPYERIAGRPGQRNGHKPRTLRTTRVGTLNLMVPQDLKRGPSPPSSSPATSETRRRSVWLSWRCTLLWPGETVKCAMDFTHDFEGEQLYMFHCHILEHETAMMLNLKVVDPQG